MILVNWDTMHLCLDCFITESSLILVGLLLVEITPHNR